MYHPMSDKPNPDWEEFIRSHQASGTVELDLTTLQPGDRLVVLTSHTAYTLTILGDHEAMMSTNREDRPSGRVRINGCTFGASSTIKPDHLFCGGNLEFTREGGREITTTTEIRALQLLQSDPPTPGTTPPV
jgi:hypothetical protein